MNNGYLSKYNDILAQRFNILFVWTPLDDTIIHYLRGQHPICPDVLTPPYTASGSRPALRRSAVG